MFSQNNINLYFDSTHCFLKLFKYTYSIYKYNKRLNQSETKQMDDLVRAIYYFMSSSEEIIFYCSIIKKKKYLFIF